MTEATQALLPVTHPIDMLREMLALEIERTSAAESFMIRSGLLADLLDELASLRQSLTGDVGMREALEGFASLEIPKKRRGNAGFYSIPFDRIEKAQAALAGCGNIVPAAEMRRIVNTLANADCECDPAFSVKTCLSCQARAALTPSPCPGDGMREALEKCAVGLEGLSVQNSADPLLQDWADGLAATARAALTPSALCGDAGDCETCGGAGEVFGHAVDCSNDNCALNGDMDSCDGKVESCHSCSADSEQLERLRSLSDRAAPAPWVVYSEPEVGLFASVFSGTLMQTGFAPVNLDDPANVEFIVEAANFLRAALPSHPGDAGEGEALRNVLWQARDTIVQHHQWHAAQTDPDPDHGFIPADEYADSQLYERTIAAIGAVDKLLETGPRDQEAGQ